MSIVAGIIVPHPPIIIPEIGGDSLADVADTVAAMERLTGNVASMDIDTIVAVSPHSPGFADAFLIRKNASFNGSFTAFGFPRLSYHLSGDTTLADSITKSCVGYDLPVAESQTADDDQLDHGVLVPYYYIGKNSDYDLVTLSISSLGLEYHYKFGEAIAAACAESHKRILFMASGDLSHRLTPSAPAGYSPAGAELDGEIVALIDKSDLDGLKNIDDRLVSVGGECGLRSLVILAGVMGGKEYKVERYAYEGPFGVGYLTAIVKPGKDEK